MLGVKTAITIFMLAVITTMVDAHEPTVITGTLVKVVDGDTAYVKIPNEDEWIEIRFYGVDCPESKYEGRWEAQPYSKEAKEFIIGLARGQQVSVRLKEEVTYDRVVGEVFVNGKSLSRELLREGLGWWNKKYEPYDLDLEVLHNQAKGAKKGLWKDANPTPPWVHRRPKDWN